MDRYESNQDQLCLLSAGKKYEAAYEELATKVNTSVQTVTAILNGLIVSKPETQSEVYLNKTFHQLILILRTLEVSL